MIIHTLSQASLLFMRKQAIASEIAYTEFEVADADCDALCSTLDANYAGQYEIIVKRPEPTGMKITRHAWEYDRHGNPIFNLYDGDVLVAFVGRSVGSNNRPFSNWHYGVIGAYANHTSRSTYANADLGLKGLVKSAALKKVLAPAEQPTVNDE